MVRLILTDALEVVVEGRVEASVREVRLGELGETLTVEGVFEMLQGQGIVEDVTYI